MNTEEQRIAEEIKRRSVPLNEREERIAALIREHVGGVYSAKSGGYRTGTSELEGVEDAARAIAALRRCYRKNKVNH